MIIKIEKVEQLDGETWYMVWAGSSCVKSFLHDPKKSFYDKNAKEDATEFFHSLIEKAKEGYPKKETILSETIESTQP